MNERKEWAGWVGRHERQTDTIDGASVAALRAALDLPTIDPAVGDPLPPLWHWLGFVPRVRARDLGPDGHARRGGFLPPVPLPRRMWAGGRFEFRAALPIGQRLQRQSTVESIESKQGRSGALVFVTVRHDLHAGETRDGGEPAWREWHHIVYREARSPAEAGVPEAAAGPSGIWQREWVPDEVLLFRYSALTFNAHRIHYDRHYACEVEGYPGLVVHGPLIATLLLDLLRRHGGDAMPAGFEFRALRPAFVGAPLRLHGTPNDDGGLVALWATDRDGAVVMRAQATR